jgi:hypothetical protein
VADDADRHDRECRRNGRRCISSGRQARGEGSFGPALMALTMGSADLRQIVSPA